MNRTPARPPRIVGLGGKGVPPNIDPQLFEHVFPLARCPSYTSHCQNIVDTCFANETLKWLPRASRELPGGSQRIARVSKGLPRTFHGRSRTSDGLPRMFQDLPRPSEGFQNLPSCYNVSRGRPRTFSARSCKLERRMSRGQWPVTPAPPMGRRRPSAPAAPLGSRCAWSSGASRSQHCVVLLVAPPPRECAGVAGRLVRALACRCSDIRRPKHDKVHLALAAVLHVCGGSLPSPVPTHAWHLAERSRIFLSASCAEAGTELWLCPLPCGDPHACRPRGVPNDQRPVG